MTPHPDVVHALSTMWSQGNFRNDGDQHDHMPSFAEKAASLGFSHIEINYVIPPSGVEALLEQEHVAVSSVHSPCPRVKVAGRLSDALNLAALDDDEREAAVQVARDSIDITVRAGAKLLVVHLGGVGDKMFDEEKQLRKLYDEGVSPDGRASAREGDEVQAIRESAVKRRREGALDYFPQARRSLAEIAEYAARHGVTIGLENRYHFSEFPNPDEMAELLSAYPPDVVGFWIDIGHVEVLDRLGLGHRHRWLDELADRCVGSHVHDVEGLADHRSPGHGTADWEHYAAKLPPHIPRIFEINQRQSAESVAEAIPFLQSVGVLP
ncbi:MAG TPA: TIM barrel protein [Dehalococcoidia bacterium]|nr:TIM barrel protein [Dehalococcoidia bacterium]